MTTPSSTIADWPAFAGTRVPAKSNAGPATAAALVIAAGAIYLLMAVTGQQALLFLVGVAAGVVLYHAAFGFTSSWRHFITSGRGEGLRAQMLMLAITCAVFYPLLGRGELFGQALRGSVSPAGVSVVVGAFLFGVGMQLGGGCASGTLYTAGGGNTRMLITLAAFIAGSVAGTAHMPWWSKTAAAKPISLVSALGVWPALAVTFAAFALITAATIAVQRSYVGNVAIPGSLPGRRPRLIFGPWPLAAGAVGLAAVNIATLVISGRPWGVTSAFALWGAKAIALGGVQVQHWTYWTAPAQAASFRAPITFDATSVMDIGIMLGAMAAAGLAGRFAPAWRVAPRSALAALFGGLLLGYGSRIAYGCNIGAYFSGIASGSLHGWLWLLAAFPGAAVGTRLRPLFGLSK